MLFCFVVSEAKRVGIGSSLDGQRVGGSGEPLFFDRNTDRARAVLNGLAIDQFRLQRLRYFEPFLESPLSRFPSSHLASELFRESGYEVFDLKAGEEAQYRENLQGKIFELLAYGILSAWQPEGRVVLSPEATVDFFTALYPRHRRKYKRGGHSTLEGVYVPDGLVLRFSETGEAQAVKALEYTKNIDTKIKDGQLDSARVQNTLSNPALNGVNIAVVYPTRSMNQDILDSLNGKDAYHFHFNMADFEIIANEEIRRILEIREPATGDDRQQRMVHETLQRERVIDGIPERPWAPWMIYADKVQNLPKE